MDIYAECVHRFRGSTRDGRLILTFTPLKGHHRRRQTVSYLGFQGLRLDPTAMNQAEPSLLCGWEDVPHITEAEKRERLANTLAYEREARIRGIPSVGRGRIFTVEEEFSSFDRSPSRPRGRLSTEQTSVLAPRATKTPERRSFGCVGSNLRHLLHFRRVFQASSPPAVTRPPSVKARGESGCKALATTQARRWREKTIDLYKQLGLKIINADKSVYAGLQLMTQMLNEGRLRVFSSCQKWLEEQALLVQRTAGSHQAA